MNIVTRLGNKFAYFNKKKYLNRGRFGSIYLYEYKNKDYVFKKIRTDMFNNEEYIAAKKFTNNKFLCRTYTKLEEDNNTYLILPYFKNGDLFDFFAKNELNENNIKDLTYQMLNCVKNLHDFEYVHLDIKLENFLINDDNNLVLCDFGNVKPILYKGKNLLIPLEKKGGTDSYLPPECNLNYYSNKSDIWNIGICIYHLVNRTNLYSDINEHLYYDYPFLNNNLSYIGNNLLDKLLKKILTKELVSKMQ